MLYVISLTDIIHLYGDWIDLARDGYWSWNECVTDEIGMAMVFDSATCKEVDARIICHDIEAQGEWATELIDRNRAIDNDIPMLIHRIIESHEKIRSMYLNLLSGVERFTWNEFQVRIISMLAESMRTDTDERRGIRSQVNPQTSYQQYLKDRAGNVVTLAQHAGRMRRPRINDPDWLKLRKKELGI